MSGQLDRFFVDAPIQSDRATLTGQEAHHLLHVLRATKGQRVTLFDGSGQEFTAEVERLGRSDVELLVVNRAAIDREPRLHLTLAVALPKGDRQKWLVEKAVEIGVAQLVPLEVARGVAQPAEAALDRLRRSVIEASKQCGRNRLMEILPGQAWTAFLAAHAHMPCRSIAHPSPDSRSSTLALPSDFRNAAAAIGPEGGFTEDEVSAAIAQGWQPLDLGPRILRIETAALVVAARIICG
jgi:16S rRNA (uracil1498-N3)-methyltransferase